MLIDQIRKYSGSAEIVVMQDLQKTSNPFFEVKASNVGEFVDYEIGVIHGNGTYKTKNDNVGVFIGGYTLGDLEKIHNTKITSETDFSGRVALIGKDDAAVYNLKIGDSIVIKIGEVSYDFEIFALAEAKGLFKYEENNISVIVPKASLAEIYQSPDKVNTIFIKTTNQSSTSLILASLNETYEGMIVKTTVTTQEIQTNIASVSSMFSLMLVLVVFISIFIIYSSFKVITLERLPAIGTLRSIGATKTTTGAIIMGEGLIYGIIGGIIGSVLGLGILYIMIDTVSYNTYTGVKTSFEMVYGFRHFLIAFLFALILSIISSIAPIRRINKIPIRDIIFNHFKETIKGSKAKIIIAFIFVIIIIILTTIPKPNIIFGAISLILMTIVLIIFIPYIAKLILKGLKNINKLLFGNEGLIASKNIRSSKTALNNIALLTIGIASILMINTVSRSVASEILDIFNKSTYEISLVHPQADDNLIQSLKEIHGVEDAYGLYMTSNIKLVEKNDYIGWAYGINPEQYFDYWQLPLEGNQTDIFNQFKTERSLITSKVILEKFDLSVGDSITLLIGNKEVSYQIIGFSNTLMNNGNIIFIYNSYFKEDTKIEYMSEVLIKTNRPTKEVVNNIEYVYKDARIMLMDDLYQSNLDNNNQVFKLLTGFSFITMMIGIFGVFNNYVINFLSRRRAFAVFRSIGMSKKQILKMLLTESVTNGLIGGIIGIIGAAVFVYIAQYISEAMLLPMKMNIEFNYVIIALLSGIIISLFAAITPALRSSKQSIIEGIKYE